MDNLHVNPYGVRVKYPDEIVVDARDARQAIADAQAIQAFGPIATVRATLEAEYKEQYTVSQATAVTENRPAVEE
jgi:hypothetical protein